MLINTGKAFFTNVQITRDISGTTDIINESVLQAFGTFAEITADDFALLSEAAANERYTAFKTYLNNLYLGLDIDAILNGQQPINENLTLCPI